MDKINLPVKFVVTAKNALEGEEKWMHVCH